MIKKIMNQIMRKVSLGVFLLALSLMVTEGFSKEKTKRVRKRAWELKPIESFSLNFKKENENTNIQIKGEVKRGWLWAEKKKGVWHHMIWVNIPADGKIRKLAAKYEVMVKGNEKSQLIMMIEALEPIDKSKPFNKKLRLLDERITKIGKGALIKEIIFKKAENIKAYRLVISLGNAKALGMKAQLKSVSLINHADYF